MCKRLGPVRVRRSKYPLLLLLVVSLTVCAFCTPPLSLPGKRQLMAKRLANPHRRFAVDGLADDVESTQGEYSSCTPCLRVCRMVVLIAPTCPWRCTGSETHSDPRRQCLSQSVKNSQDCEGDVCCYYWQLLIIPVT